MPDWWESRYGLDSQEGGGGGLAAWWELDEAGGTNAVDSSAFGNHGVLGEVAEGLGAWGRLGAGLRLDGVQGYVEAPDSASLRLELISVGVWVRPNRRYEAGVAGVLLSKEAPAQTTGYALSYEGGALVFRVAAGGVKAVSYPCTLERGQWCHVAGAYGENWQRLYTNGVVVAASNRAAGMSPLSVVDHTNTPLRIGASAGAVATNHWAGVLDDARVYGGEWSSNAVRGIWEVGADPDGDGLANRAEYEHGTDPQNADSDGDGLKDGWEVRYGQDPLGEVTNGLAAWWRLDEQRGVFLMDSSGQGNSGRLSGNSASHGTVGPSGWALNLTGTNDPDQEADYVRVEDSPSLDIASNLTLSAWVLPRLTNSARQAVFEKVDAYYLNLKNGRPQFYLDGVCDDYVAPTNVLATGQWSHVAATYDGSNMVVYVNGSAVATHVDDGLIGMNANPLWLGCGGGETRHLSAGLDELRVYGRALSSNQVWQLYQAGRDADGDGLGNLAESAYGGNPTNADTDADGLSDWAEGVVYGTDPDGKELFATIAGTNWYVGAGTGVVYTLASVAKFGWATNSSVARVTAGSGFRTDTGAFAISNVPVGGRYYLKGFLDLDGDGQYDPNEPGSLTLESHELAAGGLSGVPVRVEKVRGMRVDLGYYPDVATTTLVHQVVSNAVAWGVNTLYAYAWSYEYGTYWSTTNADLHPKGAHGSNDALRLLADEAHSNGLKVIAWFQPANSYSNAWMNHSDWRARLPNGGTYYEDPAASNSPRKYLLSPFNTNYVAWFDGVVGEVLDTGVDGVDIAETTIDRQLGTNMTYDATATNLYWQRYPDGELGDQNWRSLRAEVLTSNTFQRVGGLVRSRTNRWFHVTFVWHALDAEPSPQSLEPAQSHYRDETGFDLHDILDLPGETRPDAFNVEFLWQNYASSNIFNPGWVTVATTSFAQRVRSRVPVVSHVELTQGDDQPVSLGDFEISLGNAATNSLGGDFYDYHQAVVTNAGPTISNVYFAVP
jgi:hypothetical protein